MTRLIDVKSFRMDGTGFHGFELFEISIPRKIKTRGSACKAYPFDNNRTFWISFPSLSVAFRDLSESRDLCRIQRTNFPSVRILPSAPHCYAISRLEARKRLESFLLSYLCLTSWTSNAREGRKGGGGGAWFSLNIHLLRPANVLWIDIVTGIL